MPRAAELLRQGRNEELWQMACGFLSLNLAEFMRIQERLLMEQLKLLNSCALGKKVMRGARPKTMDEFRRGVPLTTYADYCPELLEKREDILPVKPAMWMHTSGRSGEYPFKWVPVTPEYSRELSIVAYGTGIIAGCRGWGDTYRIPARPRLVYAVAPRPYFTGALANMLEQQTPIGYLPPLEEAESLSFEERIRLGFRQALSQGFDYFFGLSLVLVSVGDRFRQASDKVAIFPLLTQPRALLRLMKGMAKSRLAGRPLLPRDLWSLKGIMCGGLDSWVYRERIKELWGRYPLDLYASTEGGIIATQTWDYDGMTFVPNLNFLEFIPEDEQLKWQMDHSYQPKTVLLDEVQVGENYEIVITNFHGGALVRYKIGDMVRITSLRNEKLGIEIPQMVFERRTDGFIDFVVVKLTEKTIWQAIEKSGIAYEDWAAYKKPGETVLHLLIEPKKGFQGSKAEITAAVQKQLVDSGRSSFLESEVVEDWRDGLDFSVEVTLLPPGVFASYTAQRQAEGADLAHLKPPHINPPDKVLSLLTQSIETGVSARVEAETEKVAV